MPSKFFKILMLFSFLFLTDCREDRVSGENNQNKIPKDLVEITPNPGNLIEQGSSLQFSAQIKKASGQVVRDAKFVWVSDDPTIFTVDQNGLAKGVKVGVARLTATSGSVTGSASVGVVNANQGASHINLSGTASYEDKPFDKNGFTGFIQIKPVRKALIQLVAIDGFQIIATGATDALGNFNFAAVDNSNNLGGVYLRVLSKSNSAGLSPTEIRNNPVNQALYSFVSPDMDDSNHSAGFFSANQNLLAKTGGAGGAFNLLDVFLDASEFIRQAGPCPPPNTTCVLSDLTAYWERGSSEGTFFKSPENEIFILGGGGNGDADEYDDSVIIHEFGHFVLSQFSKDDSPGGAHALIENDQDIRLSWSEGWANFFSSAVRNTPIYVDTLSGGLGLSFNIEDYSSLSGASLNTSAIYTTSEIAVAGVLWDLFDPIETVKDKDPLDLSFDKIWQIAMTFPVSSPATMETFWLQFENNVSTSADATGLQTIMTGRKIELFPDSGPQILTNGVTKHYTIYNSGINPDGDLDKISFTVNQGTRYTINTVNLTNGADTLLTIREQHGNETIVGQGNDNASGQSFVNCSSDCPRNNGTNLASSVSFVWPGGDGVQLNAHIKLSPIAPPSAGRFGAYDIQLTISQ